MVFLACQDAGDAPPSLTPLESGLESYSGPLAMIAQESDTMIIQEVMHDDGGLPSIDLSAYFEKPYLPDALFGHLPLTIETVDQQGNIVATRTITEEVADLDHEDVGKGLESIVAAVLRDDFLEDTKGDTAYYNFSLKMYKDLLKQAEETGNETDRAGFIAVIRGLD